MNTIDIIINIDLNYEEVEDEYYKDKLVAYSVYASRKKNNSLFLKEDGQVEFNTFVDNVLGIITSSDFDIVKTESSNRKNSLSYYISFYPVDNDGNELTKYLIHLRISSHFDDNTEEKREKRRKYYYNLSQEYKKSDKNKQYYRFLDVVINKKTKLNSPDKALDFVEYLCEQLSQGKINILSMLKEF